MLPPGFIDIHRHCDLAVLESDFGEIELKQGITTIFTGNCGMSPYPSIPENQKGLFQLLSPCLGGTSENYFRDCRSYTELLARTPLPVNLGGLIGSKQFATGLDYCFINGKMVLNRDRVLLRDAGLFLKNG